MGDYFEEHTHVYNVLSESPYKKLYEQMKPAELLLIKSKKGLIEEFEFTNLNMRDITGAGISSALFPTAIEAFDRLGRDHPIAAERYADLLVYKAEVKLERDFICTFFCLCCEKYATDALLIDAREVYTNIKNVYLEGSFHARILDNKIKDIENVRKRIGSRYGARISAIWTPIFLSLGGTVTAIFLIPSVGGSDWSP